MWSELVGEGGASLQLDLCNKPPPGQVRLLNSFNFQARLTSRQSIALRPLPLSRKILAKHRKTQKKTTRCRMAYRFSFQD
jgi:hypothetical protein